MKRHVLAAGVAGLLTLGAGTAHAAYTFQNIIDPANPSFTQALGINDAGTIVGYGNATIFNGSNWFCPAASPARTFRAPMPARRSSASAVVARPSASRSPAA